MGALMAPAADTRGVLPGGLNRGLGPRLTGIPVLPRIKQAGLQARSLYLLNVKCVQVYGVRRLWYPIALEVGGP